MPSDPTGGKRPALLNILMISDVYFPRINGVSSSIATFKREFEQLGHRVTVLAPHYAASEISESGLVRIPSRHLFVDPEDRMMKAGAVKGLYERLRAECFDVLHIQTPFIAHAAGLRLARALALPCVETYHTFFEEYLFHYLPWLPRPFLRAAARRFSRKQCNEVDAVVVPSGAMKNVLRRYGVVAPTEVIPTGVDLNAYAGGDGPGFRARLGLAGDAPVLVHVGRIAHEKNIGFLLEVLASVRASVPDVVLIIAGEGPARPAIRAQVARLRLGSHVRFTGYLDRKTDLISCYKAADAFVFASRTETQGLVLLEAMACGTPVVSTAVMGTRDVLVDGQGARVVRDDISDFAAGVVSVITDAGLRAALAARARVYAERWTAVEMAARQIAFYEQVLGTTHGNQSPQMRNNATRLPLGGHENRRDPDHG